MADKTADPANTEQRSSAQVQAETEQAGPFAVTDPQERQYFEVSNGDGTFRQVNAFGEEKGSTEDRKRFS